MPAIGARWWALLGGVLLGLPLSALGTGLEAQRIIARKAVELLPEPIAPMLRQHLDDLQERVVEPDTVWTRDKNTRDRRLWHRVAMDVDAEEQTKDARMAAAARFPTDQTAAKRLYSRLNQRGGNGVLIWVIDDLYSQLVTAFREGTESDIVRTAGYLIHFAAKASGPFNATANYDGKLTGNLHLGRVRLGHPHYAHRNVAARFGGELVRRNRGRYSDAITVSAGDYEPVDEPITRTRAVLLASLSVLDETIQADAQTIEFMQITDGKALVDRADEYYPLLDERCGDICVERLGHGAVFAANLVGGAWSAAGKPSVEQIRSRNRPVPPPAAATTAETPTPPAAPKRGNFVGSRHSNIYHYPNCTFAKQIAPDNLVVFESVEEAKTQGRRACRVCKPP